MGGMAIVPQILQRMFQGQPNPLYPQQPPQQGAPADFGGPVLPNPDNVQPRADTDPGPATKLFGGATLQTPNATQAPSMDVSNPPKNQMEPAPMQTASAMDTPRGSIAQSMQAPPTNAPIAQAPQPFHHGKLASIMLGIGEALGNPLATHIGERDRARQQEVDEYTRALPATQYGANVGAQKTAAELNREAAQTQEAQADTDFKKQQTANLVLNPPGKAEFLKELQERRLTGQDDPQSLFNEFAARAPYSHVTRQEVGDMISSTKPLPPNFKTAGGTIEPLTYGGQRYGLEASPNEPPEIASARNTAVTSLRQAEAGKFPPAVIAQLGQPPLNDPVKMKKYGADAEKIITRMAAAPRVEMMMSRPTQVADETGQVHYETAGKAMQEGGLAPSSASVSTQKHLQQAFTSGDQGKQLTAISTAREHMKTFQQLADALDNGNVQVLNRIGNALGVQFGSDKATNFKIAAQAFGGEVGKAFDGAGVTEGERKAAQGAFNPNMSPQQFRGAIQTVDSLLAGKQTALKQSYTSGQKGQPNFGEGGSQSAPAEQTATGPNGHKIALRGGRWVDATTGQPIQ